jgi:hypothetical protein
MSPELQSQRRPVLPLLFLHAAAAVACFGFFTIIPIAGCIILMAMGNDPGGPMFFPIFVMGVVACAAILTVVLAGATLLSDMLCRRGHVPLWLPPLAVFGLATGLCWLLSSHGHPAVAPIVGGVVALAFIVHWAAISTVWFLPRLLFRLFHVQHAPPKG